MNGPALDAAAITRHLTLEDPEWTAPVTVVVTTSSTNDDARRAAADRVAGAAFLAEEQTAGRGRGSHAWHSPPWENVHLSVILRPRVAAEAIAPITLAVGTAVADVVERALLRREGVGIKWPNDVLVGRRKIAGVLVEAQLRGARVLSLVVGVGLNVRTRAFPAHLCARATSLALAGAAVLDRNALAAWLIAAIVAAAARFETGGLRVFETEIARRDVLAGRRVRVGDDVGVAAGVDLTGALLLRDECGRPHPVVAGEVRVLDEPDAT